MTPTLNGYDVNLMILPLTRHPAPQWHAMTPERRRYLIEGLKLWRPDWTETQPTLTGTMQ